MKRILKEPLVQFILLGALIFGASLLRGESRAAESASITIPSGVVERLIEGFRLTWRRPPTEAEFQGLMEDYLKEEVLYREALAMGLDRDDQVVRRRLRQKLEFMTSDFVGMVQPAEADLAAFLAENPDRYRREAVLSFRQAFVRATDDEETARLRAEAVLQDLRANPDSDPTLAGDPFLYPAFFAEASELAISNTFGLEFKDAILELPVGGWEGPVASPYGLHLVRVDMREPGRVPELSEVRDDVSRDLVAQLTADAEQAFFEGLLTQYAVTVEWPEGMEPVELPGLTP